MMKAFVFTIRPGNGAKAETLRHFCANAEEMRRLALDLAAGKGVAEVAVKEAATGRAVGRAKRGRGGASWAAAG